MKATKKTASRKVAKKRVQRKKTGIGTLSSAEVIPLAIQAKDAFRYQTAKGNVEPGMTEKEWRREQVYNLTGRDGTSQLDDEHWKPVMAHFLQLAGEEEKAFELLNKTGVKGYRPTGPDDTYESSEKVVFRIKEALAKHALATVSHPKGHLHAGWLLSVARQRTDKPSLTMDTLDDRLDKKTLIGLLSHLNKYIRRRESWSQPSDSNSDANTAQSACNDDSDLPF